MGSRPLRRSKKLTSRATGRIVAAALAASVLLGGCGFARLEGVLVKESPARSFEGVKLLRGGSPVAVSRGMALRKDDILETNKSTAAVIRFEGGTEVLLEPETKVRLGSVWTFFGTVVAKVKDAFAVETEYGTAGTTSTLYIVTAGKSGLFDVTVLEGRVDVTLKKDAGEKTRTVERGSRFWRHMVEGEVDIRVAELEDATLEQLEETTRRRFERALMTVVPGVGGMTESEARRALGREKLRMEVVFEATREFKPGTVFRQDPEEGSAAARNTVVVVTVVKSAAVPNLVGSPHGRAERTLKAVGLVLGRQKRVVGKSPGTIVRQTPAAGTVAAPGTRVDVEIAAVRLPDLRKRGRKEALESLRKLGFEADPQYEGAGEDEYAIVTEQDPAPGALLLPGEAVKLTLQRRIG